MFGANWCKKNGDFVWLKKKKGDEILISKDQYLFIFLSFISCLVLSDLPPSPPARPFVGSSSGSSSSRVAANLPNRKSPSHTDYTSGLDTFKTRTTTSGIGPDALQHDYNFILRDDHLKLQNPPHLEQEGGRGRGGSLVTGGGTWPVRIMCDELHISWSGLQVNVNSRC